MKDEYIIINKSSLLKRIEELEKSEHLKSKWTYDNDRDKIEIQISLLKQILSQSTPLIPIVENTFDEGWNQCVLNCDASPMTKQCEKEKEDYTSNLKLNI